MRPPGIRSAAAAATAAGTPTRWSGSALRKASAIRRQPSPVSATTIAASARQDFARDNNRLLAANVILGDLVLLFTDRDNATVDYTVDGIHTRKQITRQPF